MPDQAILREAYKEAKNACRAGWGAQSTGDAILRLATLSLKFLEKEGELIDLVSRVPGKEYVSYRRNGIVARPANRNLFMRDVEKMERHWNAWEQGAITDSRLSRMSYTVALAPCLAMELFDRQNKKGPATYFECLIGHIFARAFHKEPTKKVSLPLHGRAVRMTMDFLFNLGKGKANIHLPVKMSTRERVVQAWAHQRLLDSGFGTGSYKGIMVLFSETKMDSRSLKVVEICVPDQWLAYQSLLAQMDKIFYFDVPDRYKSLTESFPNVIEISQFGEFFNQIGSIEAKS